jgi:ERCC4-type nuclease
MVTMKYTVIRDTREQTGWVFRASANCMGTEVYKLDTGDYSLLGYEDEICIERKGCIAEFANNLVKEKDRFFRELDRMESYRYSFIILEFTMDDLIDYPKSANLPQKVKRLIKVRGSLLLKRLIEIQLRYSVKILFCGSNGQNVATSIFKNFINYR